MKKLVVILLAMLLTFSFSVDSFAKGKEKESSEPSASTMIEEQITVTNEGGKFKVGFITVEFKKEFLNEADLPITFDVKIYAENGDVYIEFSPDVEEFAKEVTLRGAAFKGYLFDVATGENIYVEIEKQKLKVEHFSRYCWSF